MVAVVLFGTEEEGDVVSWLTLKVAEHPQKPSVLQEVWGK